MFPDPITPRSYPELLARVDYDPFHVMPGAFPPAPRVFATAEQIGRARPRVAAGRSAKMANRGTPVTGGC